MPQLHTIKKNSGLTAWTLAVLLLFAPLGAHATGAVLCIEEDGEIAVEIAEGDSCIGDGHEHSPSEEPHCEKCLDIPLPSAGDDDCTSFKVESSPSAQVALQVVGRLPSPAMLAEEASEQFGYKNLGDGEPSNRFVDSRVVLLI